MFTILTMAWDDRRHTFRLPKSESRLLASQRYFRIGFAVLAVPAASAVLAFIALVATGLTS